jgi:hypothetical protein
MDSVSGSLLYSCQDAWNDAVRVGWRGGGVEIVSKLTHTHTTGRQATR